MVQVEHHCQDKMVCTFPSSFFREHQTILFHFDDISDNDIQSKVIVSWGFQLATDLVIGSEL